MAYLEDDITVVEIVVVVVLLLCLGSGAYHFGGQLRHIIWLFRTNKLRIRREGGNA